LDLGESGILARDDGAEHRGRHARDPERHAVLERLGGEGEAHVDRVHVLRSELVEERPGRARHDRVLGLPAALAEQVLLVDDLRRRPAELEVGEADLARPLGPRPRPAAWAASGAGGVPSVRASCTAAWEVPTWGTAIASRTFSSKSLQIAGAMPW